MKKLLAILTVAGFALGASPAKADLANPNVLLDYSSLDFGFTRTAGAGAFGTVGTFNIADVAGTTLDAILRNGNAVEIDRATILNDANFEVSVSGNVVRVAPNQYSLMGVFQATDATGATKVLADFMSTIVDVSPVAFTHLFTVAGGLSAAGGGIGPILVGAAGDTWTFTGQPGDTNAALDAGGDDAISISKPPIYSYTNGDMVNFTLGVDFTSLDGLFGRSSTVGGGDMKVSIVPVPAAIGLGALGIGLVFVLKRRLG